MSTSLRIEQLEAAAFTRHLDDFQRLLAACVEQGANIGFILPLADSVNRRFWTEAVRRPGPGHPGAVCRAAGRPGGRQRAAGAGYPGQPAAPRGRGQVAGASGLPAPGTPRRLMQAVEAAARAEGRELLTLDTRSDDHAEPLYLSLGYQVVAGFPAIPWMPANRNAATAPP